MVTRAGDFRIVEGFDTRAGVASLDPTHASRTTVTFCRPRSLRRGAQHPLPRCRNLRGFLCETCPFSPRQFVLRPSPASGQQASKGPPNLPQLLAKLHSANWNERYWGYHELSLDPAAMQKDDVKAALLDLLDRENQVIESANRDEQGRLSMRSTGKSTENMRLSSGGPLTLSRTGRSPPSLHFRARGIQSRLQVRG